MPNPLKKLGKIGKLTGKAALKTADFIRNHPATFGAIPVVGPQIVVWATVVDKTADKVSDKLKKPKA